MGYTTEFRGKFICTPALNPDQAAYLQKFSDTRRMARDEQITAQRPDPIREAVGLPMGPEGAYFVGGGGIEGQEEDHLGIMDYNRPPSGQPGLWCQWIPSDDGAVIEWDGGEKFYSYIDWIEYIIEHFLKPWGVTLNGSVQWRGEDWDDAGSIVVTQNSVNI